MGTFGTLSSWDRIKADGPPGGKVNVQAVLHAVLSVRAGHNAKISTLVQDINIQSNHTPYLSLPKIQSHCAPTCGIELG